MNSLILIPFVIGLIGHEICQTPGTWKYGPEYTFRMKVNSTLTYAPTKRESCMNTTIIFKCQTTMDPTPESLKCRIKSIKSHQVNTGNSMKAAKLESGSLSSINLQDETFELLFGKEGVQSLKVSSLASVAQISIYRTIAYHLNVAASDLNQNEESFTIYKQEISMLGKCQTQIDVSTKIKFKSEQWMSDCGDSLHLETLTYGDKHPLVVINKTRDAGQCSNGIPYLLGSDEANANYNITKTSSFTEYVIAPMSFGSLTFTEGFMMTAHLPEKLMSTEFADLRLINVEPAGSPFKHSKHSDKLEEIKLS